RDEQEPRPSPPGQSISLLASLVACAFPSPWAHHTNNACESFKTLSIHASRLAPRANRCCCTWRRDIFHNCEAAIHLCSVNPNTQLFSGDCLKPFDGVMVTDNRCTLFECMIRSKPRAELVGIIHQNFSFMEWNFRFLTRNMVTPSVKKRAGKRLNRERGWLLKCEAGSNACGGLLDQRCDSI